VLIFAVLLRNEFAKYTEVGESAICNLLLTRKYSEAFSFRGLHPLTLDKGLCPWTPLQATLIVIEIDCHEIVVSYFWTYYSHPRQID